MKQNFKRLLSIVLTCVMLFSMMPVSAFATEAEQGEPAPVSEATVVETTAPETTVPETTLPETTVPETTVPETTVPETTVPETTVPETTVPETTVPEETVPQEAEADPVKELYDTLMAFDTYEELGDYMDAMTEEQYALMDQFSDEQNNALLAKVDQLTNDDAAVYAPPASPTEPTTDGDHTFTHLDVRIEGVSLKLTKRVVNMVTGVVVSTSDTTITANLTKVESVTINGVVYSNFTKMTDREWRQSNVKINLSALTDSSTAVLIVDLEDTDGNTYNDVRITYNRAGIQYAIEHCDGYKNGQYDGIDFDPSEGANNITRIDYDDYVIPVMKIWDDANNQDGIRPASVTVNLYANGELNDSVVLNESNSWQDMFRNKPSEDSNGDSIAYTIDEATVPTGYTKTVGNNGTHLTVTNSHTPEVTSVSGTKTWDDADNQDGKRPDSITVELLADGVSTGKTATATAAGGWTYSFTDLPKYAAGKEIEYTVAEAVVPEGYTSVVNGMNLTNTHTPEKTSVSGEKTWDDNDDQDGKRPDSITINLLANGNKVASKTVTADDNWAWTFDNLDKYANGEEITYSITEDAVTDYTSQINGYNVTNTHTPEKTSVSGSKTWVDNDDQDGKRPDSITIRLFANSTEVDSKTVTADDNWAWTFDNLDKYANGEEITYSITEDAVTDYTSQISGYNVTNTHEIEKTSVSGSKTWVDNDDQDGKRPASITINLLANGNKVASKTVTANDGWAWSFTDLDKYANGQEITYTITENEVDEYTSVVSGYNVTNTHTPEKTFVSGSKTWIDNNDQDGKRPDSITIRLLADGVEVASKTVTATNDWEWKFEDLDVYKNGTKIVYTITEDAVVEYTSEVSGYNVTNTHEIEKTSVSGSKTWIDNNDQDGKRPESITINLLADGVELDHAVVTAENGWSWSFADLDKYANGKEIVYSITEDAVAEYTSEVNGYNVTNTHKIEKVSVSGTKVWNDNDNQDGIRPQSITVNLLADGTKIKAATVSAAVDGTWTFTFEDLDKYAAGKKIVYTVTEEAVNGYTTAIEGTTITNTHETEETSVSVKKVWDDKDDQDGIRPDSVSVMLYADGEPTSQTLTLNEDNDWAGSFTGLDKYRDGGTVIAYTVVEADVAKYSTEITGDQENGYTVTNSYTPETVKVAGAKTWKDDDDRDGLRPESITINLLADGEEVDAAEVTADDWSWSFENLPKYRDHGTEIVYTITEDAVEGYESVIDGFNVTNTHEIITTEASGSKTWDDNDDQDGLRPESITINLLADGEIIETITVTEEDAWAWTFENLPKYRDHGTEIVYTITEDAVEDYTSEVSGFNVTNTHEIITTEVSGSKTWDDNDDQDGIRPDSITINLLADGEIIETITVTEEDAWAWTFEDLPKYRDHGTEIVYAVTEVAVEGYETAINGYTVTNTHEIITTEVSGSKTWDDNDDRDGLRPASITINLLADGEIIETITVTEEDAWAWTFENLPKYRDHGVEIVYTVEEVAVEGYEAAVEGFNVTNTHEIETTEVSGSKTWDDNDDQDGIRPDSIAINLLADGEIIETITVTEEDAWAWTFENLPKYRDHGIEIVYAVTEVAVEGYETAINGYTVTNTHTPEQIDLTVEKVWDDAEDQDGKRPASITVNLLANGEVFETVTITAEDGWKYEFKGLDKYAAGEEIEYTVTEEPVEGYEAAVEGMLITNTHAPEKTSVSGAKTWDDNDDQDGIRPDSITINLLADGEIIETITVTEEDAWAWTFEDLYKYANGREIVYTIAEDAVEGYESVIDGFNVTNTHTPAVTVISVSKVWADSNNAEGLRPGSITIKLLANGVDTGKTLTLDAAGGWSGSFADLPVYADGVAIEYTVDEVAVKGYTTVIKGNMADGFTVVNTHVYIPQTGDDRTPMLWISMMAVSAMMIALASMDSKKRRNATK